MENPGPRPGPGPGFVLVLFPIPVCWTEPPECEDAWAPRPSTKLLIFPLIASLPPIPRSVLGSYQSVVRCRLFTVQRSTFWEVLSREKVELGTYRVPLRLSACMSRRLVMEWRKGRLTIDSSLDLLTESYEISFGP